MSSYTATFGYSFAGTMGRWQHAVAESLTTLDEDDNDEALVVRVAQSDQVALARLVSRHSDRAYAFATRLLGSRTEAEDAVQDLFLKLWTDAGRWRTERGRFAPWFFRILYNLCIDRIRRRRTVGLDAVADMASDEPGPEEQAEQTMTQARVAAALQGLPERQRAAVLLCYFHGLTNREAAEILDVGIKGLEALLVRARRQLARDLVAGTEA